MRSNKQHYLLFVGLLTLTACQRATPESSLVDGCYYFGKTAVIKITGNSGQIKIPGDIKDVIVEKRQNKNASMVVFSPGFFINGALNLTAVKQSQFPKYHYMMNPYSPEPVILMPTVSKQILPLKLGTRC